MRMSPPARDAYRVVQEAHMMQAVDSMANAPETTEVGPETAWAAVRARDTRYDGRFVYAVRSTGIFCRPSCPSRRPHRRHGALFAPPARARGAAPGGGGAPVA